MNVYHYLNPFLTSHGLHLIVGPRESGKTAYALQMLATKHSDGPESSPWTQFPRAEIMPDVIWYVDLIKPRKQVLAHISRLGLGEPDATTRTLKILTYDQVLEIRPEANRKDPVTFSDILMRIGIETHGVPPEILIIDGLGTLLTSVKDQQAYETERLREIDREYLSKGGCLIGIQTFSKSGRIAGISETPGTHFLNAFVSSVTELSVKKGNIRWATISGSFPRRSMVLEFVDPGRLQIARMPEASAPIPHPTVTEREADSKGTSLQILMMAIQLSLNDTLKEFARGELVTACEPHGISRATVDRWMKRTKDAGSLIAGERYGYYSLFPKPADPDLGFA